MSACVVAVATFVACAGPTPTAAPAARATTSTPAVAVEPVDLDLPEWVPTDLGDLPGTTQTIELTACTLVTVVETGALAFAKDSAALPADGSAREQLDAILDQYATASEVTVHGHTSSEGSREHNDRLSEQRAEVVAAAGRARHPEVTWRSVGHGPTQPRVPEDGTEATRAKNRRVELVGQVERPECHSI